MSFQDLIPYGVASFFSCFSPGVGDGVGAGVGDGVGAVVGRGVGEGVGFTVGAGVGGGVVHSKLKTAIPPSPSLAAMDTKSRSVLEVMLRDMPAMTPLTVPASSPTSTVAGADRDPVEGSLWNNTIWRARVDG